MLVSMVVGVYCKNIVQDELCWSNDELLMLKIEYECEENK